MVVIKSFLPNPVGNDAVGEYVVLKNTGAEKMNLSGWRLVDLSGKAFSLSGYSLAPGEEVTLFAPTTGLRLNNGGETLFLFDKTGALVDRLVALGIAQEGVPVVRHSELGISAKSAFFDDAAMTGYLLAPGRYLAASNAHLQTGLVVFGFSVAVLAAIVGGYVLSKISLQKI